MSDLAAPEPPDLAPSSLAGWRGAVACLALAALVVAVFGQVVGFQFVTSDDHVLIAGNRAVTHWWDATWEERGSTLAFGYMIPVTVASLALDWSLWSGDPAGFHLVNLVLHLACALLVLRMLARVGPTGAAWFAAALFAVHPVQAEAVSFVTQRKDLLLTFFALLAFDALRLPARSAPTTTRLGLAAVAATLAALCKPSGSLVGVMCAAGLAIVHRGGGANASPPRSNLRFGAATRVQQGLVIATAAIGLVLLACNLYVAHVAPMALAPTGATPLSLWGRMATTLAHYSTSLAIPFDLSPKVPVPSSASWGAWGIAMVTIAAFTVALARALRRGNRPLVVACVWCALAYLPISNALPLSRYVADSLLYVPAVGLAIAAACAAAFLWRQAGRGSLRNGLRFALTSVALSLLVMLSIASHGQASVWRDERHLFGYLYRLYPRQREAFTGYVEHLERTGHAQEASLVRVDYYARASQHAPGSMAVRHQYMRALLAVGEPEQARAVLGAAPAEQRASAAWWEAKLEWSMATRQKAEAIEAVEALLRLDPTSEHARLLPMLRR